VRVRINDRGPYIGQRMIDLSYAAAQQIGLIEPGTGDVDIRVIKLGLGDLEPPAPYEVKIQEPKEKVVVPAGEPPRVDFPLPTQTSSNTQADFHVEVVEQKAKVDTRRQVSADGTKIEDVPAGRSGDRAAPVPPRTCAAEVDRDHEQGPGEGPKSSKPSGEHLEEASVRGPGRRVLGRGECEGAAAQLTKIGQQSFIDHDRSTRRIGPCHARSGAEGTDGLETRG
jgi:hypothetical protein